MSSQHPEREPEPPVVPDRAREDTDAGWGERDDEGDDERYLRERPPHW